VRAGAFLRVVPCTIEQANSYVLAHHRHNDPVPIARFALAAVDEAGLVRGVAIVGRPVARADDDGLTAEVRRLATDGTRNACSLLYGASRRACKAMGFTKLLTFTLAEEGGTSLRASGATYAGKTTHSGHGWGNRPGRTGVWPAGQKDRWEWHLNPPVAVTWPEPQREPMPLFDEGAAA
jgi:hypothetical protein